MKKFNILLIALLLLTSNIFAQWKISETFDSEIPVDWSGDLGNPGFYWLNSSSGHTGVVKGATGNSSAEKVLITSQIQVGAADSLYFNHFVIANTSDAFKVYFRINSGTWTLFLSSGVQEWIDENFSLTDLTGVNTGDLIDFKISVNGDYNFCYIDYFKVGKTPPTQIPNCSQLLFPEDNASELHVYQKLKWSSTAQTEEYLINFGTDNPPTNILNNFSNGVDTSFQLPTLDLNQTYYWQVIPSNSLGTPSNCDIFSFTTKTNFFPLAIDMEDPQLGMPSAWIVEEGGTNTGMGTWHPAYNTAGNGHNNSNGFMSIAMNVSNPKDSWLISEPLPLLANKLYKITFYYRTLAMGAYEFMEVKFGTEQSIAGMTTQIWDNQLINIAAWQQGICYIKPDIDGEYYLSWHAYSDPEEFNIMLDDITIEELDDGAGAYTQPFTKTLPITKINDSTDFTLNIANQGSGTLDLISADYPEFISGPESFSIADNQDIDFKFVPSQQGACFDTIYLETNGGTLKVSVLGNSAKKVYPITSLLTINDHFTVINNDNNDYTWQMNWVKPFEGEYSFQVQENWDCTGYDDWIITEPVYVLENDVFTFIARSHDALNGAGQIRIMLSTNAGITIPDFDVTVEPYFELSGEWTAYSFDLTGYAGQIVRLAIHSYSTSMWTMRHFVDNIGFPAVENPMICSDAIFPADQALDIELNPILRWEQIGIANDYLLFFGTDNPPTNIHNGINTGNLQTFDISGLEYNTTYYWNIVPLYGDIIAENCDVKSFTTIDLQSITELNNELTVYSFDDKVFVKNPLLDTYNLKIYSTDGKLIYENFDINTSIFETEINLRGIVFINIIKKNSVSTYKTLIK